VFISFRLRVSASLRAKKTKALILLKVVRSGVGSISLLLGENKRKKSRKVAKAQRDFSLCVSASLRAKITKALILLKVVRPAVGSISLLLG
jgi:hypothetical protein